MKSIHRCLACVATTLVCSGLLAAPARAEGRRTKAELRYQTLNLFQRHCLSCHGEAGKGGVRILDHSPLVAQRQVVRPGSPETSELFDLVQGGSMPPGISRKVPEEEVALLKEWIRGSHEALPSTHDESYVLWSIVRDLRTKTDEQKRSIRYLSLNHLLAQDRTLRKLGEQRENLERMLRDFVPQGKQPSNLRSLAIEPTNTVFRIDLQNLGWDRHPYPQADKRWRHLNLFDLILLEYPHGRLPNHSPFYAELLPFLLVAQEAGQVRPIPYLRGDWLAEAIRPPQSPLRADFLHVLGKPIRGDSPRPDPRGAVAGTAEWQARGASLDRPLERAKPFFSIPPHPLRGGEEKARPAFHERLADVADGDTNRGLPIVPLDGLGYPNHKSSDHSFVVQFRSTDFTDLDAAERENREPHVKSSFVPGEELGLWFKASEPSVVELYIPAHNLITPHRSFDARKGVALTAGGIGMNLREGIEKETEEFTIFTYTEVALNAESSFPRGTLLHAGGIRDRLVHPLYELRPDGKVKPPDPSKMVKATLSVTTCRPKAKP